MQNKTRFKEMLTLVGEKYGVEVSKAMGKLVWGVLKPYSDADCEKALMEVVLYGRFHKDLLPDLMERLDGGKQEQATKAWLKVDYAIRHIGHWSSVKFDDPVIHSVIEGMGGWEALCAIENSEMKWKRKEFENLYPILVKREMHPEYLIGLCDRQNMARGFNGPVSSSAQVGNCVIPKRRIKALEEPVNVSKP